MRRLIFTSLAALTALYLLFLENKCSYFLGEQELVAEVKPATPEPAEGTPEAEAAKGKPRTYEIVLKDVAGNILQTTGQDLAEVKRRLAGAPGTDQKPIQTQGEPTDRGLSIEVTTPPEVAELDLSRRMQARPFKRANPPRELFHINRGIDISGGVEFVCRLHREDRVVPADDEVVHILRNRLDERGLTEPQVSRLSNGDVQVVIPGGTRADAARTRKVLETTGRLEFRHVLNPYMSEQQDYSLHVGPHDAEPLVIKGEHGYELNPARTDLRPRGRHDIVAPEFTGPGETPRVFYLCGPAQLTGSDVKDAGPTTQDGQLGVSIEFTAVGAVKNQQFTSSAMVEQADHTGTGFIAILFDGMVRSAPIVRGASSNQCAITGGRFTEDEVESLRSVLRGGSLAVTPEVLSERVVGATLGEQTVYRTLIVRVISFLAIVAFMWLYYHRLGTVANLCLVATGFFIWSTLSVFNATLTLPGFAGLVLTIGMAVDTNILIFERIREELREDKGLKAAIAAGYDRAFLTIVDAHLTTFITAFILYWIGTGPVKGFGLTLMIGIVVNLFSGVYIGRMLTDWLCRKKQTLSMASWVPGLRLPYVEWRWVAYGFSIVTAVAGLGWFAFGHQLTGGTFERNFDIDFTGGNAAQVVFKQPMELKQVEEAVKKAHDSDPQRYVLLDPKELRLQAYYADLTGGHGASREWIFRGRDEEGGRIEKQRAELEAERAGLERKVDDLRGDKDLQNPEAKKIEAEQIAPLAKQIKDLSDQISNRTETFKSQIAGAFGDQVGQEGDEVVAAAVDGTAVKISLAVLEPVKDDQLAGIADRLAAEGRYLSATPTFQAEPRALAVAATLRTQPPVTETGDRVATRLRELLRKDGMADAELAAKVSAAETVYQDAVKAAATRRVTVAKAFPSSEHFSGQVATQMKVRALIAIVLSLFAILAYVAARFEFRFGIGAVVALLHDVLMTVGIISVLKIRIDLSVIAALLTIIGYSINETIVNFDRIRENLRKLGKPLAETINISLAQTMARTVLTASTVIITLVVLLIFGGDAMIPFTATLLIGIISGTYSAVFVASPLLLSFKGRIVENPPSDGSAPAGGAPESSNGQVASAQA